MIIPALTQTLKILFVAGICIIAMSNTAIAAEMTPFQQHLALKPIAGTQENFMRIRPGGDVAQECTAFCKANPTCTAAYYKQGESMCFFYKTIGYELVEASGHYVAFKTWSK